MRPPPRLDPPGAGQARGAIVVLGCRVVLGRDGRLVGALGRRVEAAAEEYRQRGDSDAVVVASGGRRWSSLVEADAIAGELGRLGVPERAIVRERCSLSTRENARFAAEALARRGMTRATVVSCAWHLPRAVALFRRRGIAAEGRAARTESATWRQRVWRWGRENVLSWLQMRRP